MAASRRGSARPVEAQLFDEGHRFDFYQAVALLEQLRPSAFSVGETAEPHHEAVRFKSMVGVDFPASDVVAVDRPEEPRQPPVMHVSFMTLAGFQGPLPNVVAEMVMQREWRKDTAFKAFLDIFNHRLVSLMYRVRRKTRPALGNRPPQMTPFARYLFAFMGLGTPRLANRMGVADRGLLPYVGLLAGRARSMPGLATLLADYFAVPVRVEPFRGRWLQLDESQRTALGGLNSALGVDTVIGARVWDQMSSFNVTVGPVGLQRFLDFLPIGGAFRPAVAMTRFYAGEQFDFDLRLKLHAPEVPQARLSAASGSFLGWTTWLGRRPGGQAQEPAEVRLSSTFSGKKS